MYVMVSLPPPNLPDQYLPGSFVHISASHFGHGPQLPVAMCQNMSCAAAQDMMSTICTCEAPRGKDKSGRKYNRAHRKGIFGQKK